MSSPRNVSGIDHHLTIFVWSYISTNRVSDFGVNPSRSFLLQLLSGILKDTLSKGDEKDASKVWAKPGQSRYVVTTSTILFILISSEEVLVQFFGLF